MHTAIAIDRIRRNCTNEFEALEILAEGEVMKSRAVSLLHLYTLIIGLQAYPTGWVNTNDTTGGFQFNLHRANHPQF